MTQIDERAIAKLEVDVVDTLGEEYRPIVRAARDKVRFLQLRSPTEKVIEDVQQYIHDTHIHTSWPPCPRHPKHPLWYHDGGWWCERDRVRIAHLGMLSSLDHEKAPESL